VDAYRAAGEAPIPALHLAADDVLDNQTDNLALQRRIATDMRDIWAMQPRFERRTGKAPYKLLENPRFRAGYDFLLLRCESGELEMEIGEWWTAFYEAEAGERERLVTQANRPRPAPAKRRSARRAARRATGSEGAGSDAGTSDAVPSAATSANDRWVGIGANLGDARANVLDALARLDAQPGCRLLAASSLWRTAPIDSSGDDYINAVAQVDTSLDAHALLAALQAIELAHGRERPYRNAPRTLDLDLLLYGDARSSTRRT
jgi:2-amino-4-hydroxy-6-hydroxymethyldihydropteridine diphosphokinase